MERDRGKERGRRGEIEKRKEGEGEMLKKGERNKESQ